jgi:hypothetical protein
LTSGEIRRATSPLAMRQAGDWCCRRSTENNARRMREAFRQVDEGRLFRTSLDEICARFERGGV